MTAKVVVQRRSLEPGHVGEPLGLPTISEHKSAAAAVRALHRLISHDARHKTIGASTYFIEIDGERLSLNAAYVRIFGALPGIGRDGKFTYPLLRKA